MDVSQADNLTRRMSSDSSLIDLPWEDVLFPNIISRLSTQTIFSLRTVNSDCRMLVDKYFELATNLNLSDPSITREKFEVMTRNAKRLQSIEHKCCREQFCKIYNLGLVFHANKSSLKSIVIKNCPRFSLTLFLPLTDPNRLGSLDKLILKQSLSSTALSWDDTEILAQVGLANQQLTYLSLKNLLSLTHETAQAIITSCPRLRVVKLLNCEMLTDSTLETLAKRCQHLETVKIKGCWRVTKIGRDFISEFCRNLKVMEINLHAYPDEIILHNIMHPIRLQI